MPPTTAVDKQKLLMQQEIAKLSGAIGRHSATSSSRTHHAQSHPYARGRASHRGSRGRGRGRGGSYSLDLRQPSTSNPANSSSDQASVDGSARTDWVKTSQSRGGNISIMTAEKSAQLQARPRKPPPKIHTLASSSNGQRVVIDGVIFQFEDGGQKLSRIGEIAESSTPTRRRVNYGGNKYRRTSRGNLVQSRKSKSSTPCRYYTKTGRCNRALTCPYAHIPGRLAVCPRFLRSTCEAAESCPLSHQPSAHNTPSCLNFQANSTCRFGSACAYPHVKVASDAPICEAFARGGWCDNEPGTCEELHVWECGEFREKGTCARGGKCGLRHVLRAEKGKKEQLDVTDPAESAGGFEENADFVNFDQGSPPEVEEDSEVDSEDDGDHSAASSDDGEGDESDSGESPSTPSQSDDVMVVN